MTELHKAAIFACVLLLLLAYACSVVVSETQPWVLGTERQGDGTVEYLCLGRGCEDLS